MYYYHIIVIIIILYFPFMDLCVASEEHSFCQDVTFMSNVVARDRKMLISRCSSAGFSADSLWGGWRASLCEMSMSEIEAKEAHHPTVKLTIHPHWVNERPPTLLLLPLPPSLSPSTSFSDSLSFLPRLHLTLTLMVLRPSLSLSLSRSLSLSLSLSSPPPPPSTQHPLAPVSPVILVMLITVTWNH